MLFERPPDPTHHSHSHPTIGAFLMTINRRDFVRTSLAAGAALTAPALRAAAKANQTYRTALVGTGWWGMNILREAIRSGQCRVVAMCDVDENQLRPAVAEVEKLS